jgi:hypothetical protein
VGCYLRLFFNPITSAIKQVHWVIDVISSSVSGGKIKMNPRPLVNDEKLDTANGMKNRRNVCHRLASVALMCPMLSISAKPINALMPAELSQMLGVGSKWCATVSRYQIRSLVSG